MSVEESELDLYADNTGELYPQHQAIILNLKRKIAAGRYDASKAYKLWEYWYTNAAKRYAKEYSVGSDWSKIFPAIIRRKLAKERARDEHVKILNGEYGPPLMFARAKRRSFRTRKKY